MSSTIWQGVMPAITTAFTPDGQIDLPFIRTHVQWLIENGCTGIVPCGSLGEGATLSREEKSTLIRTCVETAAGRATVVPGIAALGTGAAIDLARDAENAGCDGVMVLPPYAYSTDWREMKAHVQAVIRATPLPCILYNNPIAYKTDFLPHQIEELARECPNLEAVKESSADVRRITEIKALTGERLALGVGVDDAIVEGIAAGAKFWIAGLVNAMPKESVRLFDLAMDSERERAFELYRWFLPLLRFDVVPKFVQLIKLAQQRVGMGSTTVRPPRIELEGAELSEALAVLNRALASRPIL